MSSNDANDRKRKPTIISETVSSSDGRNPKEGSKKARIVSKNVTESTAASLPLDTPEVTENVATANAAAAAAAATTTDAAATAPKQDVSIERIGALIRDMFHSDNAKVHGALDALFLDLAEDIEKTESLVTVGGCHALVHQLEKCLDKAIDMIPACDQVTKLNELADLMTLDKTLDVIINLTYQHDKSRVAIAAIGGVEAVVKVMKAFPKCQALQWRACQALSNLACNNNVTGQKKAIESGAIEVVLAAVKNHLNAADVCQYACWALYSIANNSKENTGLLISLGGAAAVAKVRTMWPDNEDVQTWVRELAKLLAAEMKTWADEE
jgi:hypothetical protein